MNPNSILTYALTIVILNFCACFSRDDGNDAGTQTKARSVRQVKKKDLYKTAERSDAFSDPTDGPCGFNFTTRVLWSSPVGGPGSPFVASPILAPLQPPSSHSASLSSSSSNFLIISAAFHGEIGVFSASNGRSLPGSRYPVHLPSATVYASPLLHDVDSDGALDVVVVTGEGVVHAFDLLDGAQLVGSYAIDALRRVDKKWLDGTVKDGRNSIFPDLTLEMFRDGVVGEEEEEDKSDEGGRSSRTKMEPRVLASSVIVDLNGDGRVEEMIVPVTFSSEDYLLTSLWVLNATSGFSVLKRVPLELSAVASEFPAYLLHAPTVVDLDSRSGDVEILIASTSGRVFAFDSKLEALRVGFPVEVDSLVAPVVTHDLTSNGRLELVLVDRSGVVHCYDTKGNLKWQTSLADEIATPPTSESGPVGGASPLPSSSPPSTSSSNLFSIVGVPRVFSFDSAFDADALKIGVTTTDGFLYILSGVTGAVVARQALSAATGGGGGGSPLAAGLLVTRVVTNPDDGPPDLISLSIDGHLHVVTTRTTVSQQIEHEGKSSSTTHRRVTCHERVELGESAMASLLSADLDASVPGHEILVASHDGVLMALTITPTSPDGRRKQRRERSGGANTNHGIADARVNHNINDPEFTGLEGRRRAAVDESAIPSWESEIPDGSRFGFDEPAPALVIKDWTRSRHHVTGETFSVAFDVGEAATESKDELLRVKVSLGSLLLIEHSITRSGFHVLRVRAPDEPMRGHLIVRMTNRHGQVFTDSFPISLNEALVHDLQWVLLAPFVATVVTYLVVHGYPEEETLPTTVFKGR